MAKSLKREQYVHVRNWNMDGTLNPKGGATAYFLPDTDDEGHACFHWGVAMCSPQDAYNKAVGRTKAKGQTLSLKHRLTCKGRATLQSLMELVETYACGKDKQLARRHNRPIMRLLAQGSGREIV
jgi:hypothetical protein